MFLYYLDSRFFKRGRKSETLCTRVLRLCERQTPNAVLIHGDIHDPKEFQRFVRALQTMHIPCVAIKDSFEETDFYEDFTTLSMRTLKELHTPVEDILYVLHKDDVNPIHIYMQLFVHHSINDDLDFSDELERQMQVSDNGIEINIMKRKMN